jgi:hypothetical protein
MLCDVCSGRSSQEPVAAQPDQLDQIKEVFEPRLGKFRPKIRDREIRNRELRTYYKETEHIEYVSYDLTEQDLNAHGKDIRPRGE